MFCPHLKIWIELIILKNYVNCVYVYELYEGWEGSASIR